MKSEKVEYNELIAIRSPPGDRWRLVDDQEEKIHDGKLYSINSQEVEVEEVIEEPKEYGIYGEVNWKQGV